MNETHKGIVALTCHTGTGTHTLLSIKTKKDTSSEHKPAPD